MYTNIHRSERIASIIDKRRPLAQKIATVEANLHSLASALRNLDARRQNLLTQTDDSSTSGSLQQINFSKIEQSINTELDIIAKLRARFARNTLNIGVVGRARQGKSRLLQTLTGLSAAEIPDGNRQHCTGVKSTIFHKPNVQTYGEVEFHNEQSFLNEVILPYYEQLNLSEKPITVQEFASKPLPTLPNSIVGAEFGAKYEHLRRYHKDFAQYSGLLRTLSNLQISQNEIRQYVAQDDSDGNRVYFNYLAVKGVKIYCNFPNSEVGKIALVDMPGLGDTGIGDEERLIQTLGEEIDFVLFVRMPKTSGDYIADVDVRLYDTTAKALVELPVNLWSFMILNQTDAGSTNGDNSNNCQDLASSMAEKHINVSRCLTANCADSEQVNTKILEQVLDYLANNINSLDRQYASACQESVNRLQNAVRTELEKASQALGKQEKTNQFLFNRLFKKFWEYITNDLEGLLNTLRDRRDVQDNYFKTQVEEVFKACRDNSGIPTLEQIDSKRNTKGSFAKAYADYLDEIRTQLSQRFLRLDDGLKQSIEEVKSSVTEVLVKQREQGNLGGITDARGSDFLSVFAEKIPTNLRGLKLGFQIISEFELSYRGLIQHRIRKHLDILTPDLTARLPQNPSKEDVLDTLEELYPEAVYKCENALQSLLSEPSEAAFAMVEEFVDQVRRAKDVDEEWREFLEPLRAEVWSQEFKEQSEKNRIREEWLTLVNKTNNINQAQEMQFLN